MKRRPGTVNNLGLNLAGQITETSAGLSHLALTVRPLCSSTVSLGPPHELVMKNAYVARSDLRLMQNRHARTVRLVRVCHW
jgi:hypothetical protein